VRFRVPREQLDAAELFDLETLEGGCPWGWSCAHIDDLITGARADSSDAICRHWRQSGVFGDMREEKKKRTSSETATSEVLVVVVTQASLHLTLVQVIRFESQTPQERT
jgi:hypothetical protein